MSASPDCILKEMPAINNKITSFNKRRDISYFRAIDDKSVSKQVRNSLHQN
jgi:hypothetical protein